MNCLFCGRLIGIVNIILVMFAVGYKPGEPAEYLKPVEAGPCQDVLHAPP